LSNEVCTKTGIDTGDQVQLSLKIASPKLPEELADLIRKSAAARARWDQLTLGQKRMLREEVLAAKLSSTRARRAARGLGVE
jgi:uncharacterized protein YdeI (YjbR/CyaY-like superfamily)